MSELSVKVAQEHQRVWSLLAVTCRCGWSWTTPEEHQVPFTAHISEVTEAAVRETIAADIEAARERRDRDNEFAIIWASAYSIAARIARGET